MYRGKRLLDLLVLAALAVPAGLTAAVCAVAVRATSRGPVLFRQQRTGMGERTFELLKFRTMVDAPDNPLFPDDARITPVGRWLRRLSLDELPQLWNVARGDMSIVGPRPTMLYQLELFDARQRGRFTVPPGITGLAQVRGRNTIGWAERVEHDLEYVRRRSLWLDLVILARTPGALLGGAGGHPEDDPLTRATSVDGLDDRAGDPSEVTADPAEATGSG
jgi:sugar transferase EpsL